MTHKLLNIDWAHLFEGQDMDAMWLCFHTKLLNLIDKTFQLKVLTPNPNPNGWIYLHSKKLLVLCVKTLLLQLLNIPNCHLNQVNQRHTAKFNRDLVLEVCHKGTT